MPVPNNLMGFLELAKILWEIFQDKDFDYEDKESTKDLATEAINMTKWTEEEKNRRIILASMIIEEIFESFFKPHEGPVPIQ